MKFQVREGYVVRLVEQVEIGDGKTQTQETNFYEKQVCDLTADQADQHIHKLEPRDKAAEAYLASKVAPVSAPVAAGPQLDIPSIIQAAVLAALAAGQAAATPATPKP